MARHGLEALFNGMSQTHRPFRFPGQRGGKRLGLDRELAAVAAAEIGHDDANLIERQMKNLGEMLAQGERLLRAGPKRQPVAFVIGHGRVRLHGKMLHPRKSKSILENMIRLGKAFVDVAFGITEAITEIGAGEFFRRFVMLAHQFAAARRGLMH